ncbi:MAG: hypothetical protein PVH91_00515 [Pseudomonadales bacterium]
MAWNALGPERLPSGSVPPAVKSPELCSQTCSRYRTFSGVI